MRIPSSGSNDSNSENGELERIKAAASGSIGRSLATSEGSMRRRSASESGDSDSTDAFSLALVDLFVAVFASGDTATVAMARSNRYCVAQRRRLSFKSCTVRQIHRSLAYI